MKRDDVIRIAQDAGLLLIDTADGGKAIYTWPKGITKEIEHFAALVAAHEREECAKIAIEEAALWAPYSDGRVSLDGVAAAIKVRR